MAIISCNTLPRRTGSWELNNATYSETWVVEAEAGDDPYTILNYVWDFITLTYHGTSLHTLTCDQIDRFNWTVTGTWKNLTPEEKDKTEVANPLDRATVYSYSTRETDALAEWDIDSNAITNSAGDALNPAPTMRQGKSCISVTKNYSSFDPSAAAAFTFKVNSNSMFGIGSNQLLCTNITASQQSESVDGEEYVYYAVTFDFEVDTEYSHTLRLIDCGYRELDDDDKLVRIKDANGEYIADPALLDGEGKKLEDGSDPVAIESDIYQQADFSVFGF